MRARVIEPEVELELQDEIGGRVGDERVEGREATKEVRGG